ncbi:MAG TPA: DoxX family membrane protein [Pseudolabrys sp.]
MLNKRATQEAASGELAMARLADRLATLVPPPALELSRMQAVSMPRPSPAVTTALNTSAAIAARAAERARRSRSVVGMTVDSFISACAMLPYGLVALALRLLMARIFFLDGQTRLAGLRWSLHLPIEKLHLSLPFQLPSLDFSVVLPFQVKADTIADFATQYPPIPMPPAIAAYVVSYAEFLLPICLVLGFATRFASLGLLFITALIAVFVVPNSLPGEPIFWASILLVLLSLGGGAVSIDNIVRMIARR